METYRQSATKEDVRRFWEDNPLFAGEIELDPMSRDFFDQHERVYRSDVLAGDFTKEFFPFPRGASVLDVGCGPGIWTRELARRGFTTTAVDLTESAVRITRRSLDLFALKANVQQGDAEDLPFPDCAFNGIVSHGVIHHTPDTQRCVHEMARVLRSGGIAVVSVYYRNFVLRSPLLTRLAGFVLGRWVSLSGRGREGMLRTRDADELVRLYDGASNPLGRSYTAHEFDKMFEDAGLQITKKFRYYFPRRAFGRIAYLIGPIQPVLASRFGLMYAVHARKKR